MYDGDCGAFISIAFTIYVVELWCIHCWTRIWCLAKYYNPKCHHDIIQLYRETIKKRHEDLLGFTCLSKCLSVFELFLRRRGEIYYTSVQALTLLNSRYLKALNDTFFPHSIILFVSHEKSARCRESPRKSLPWNSSELCLDVSLLLFFLRMFFYSLTREGNRVQVFIICVAIVSKMCEWKCRFFLSGGEIDVVLL